MTCPQCRGTRVRVIREIFAPNDPNRAKWYCDDCANMWPLRQSSVYTTETREQQRIALGLRPKTRRGWMFWLRHWSPFRKWLPRRDR